MLTPYNTNLPPDLRALKEEIEGYARGYGLDFYETIFEVVDADDLNEIAAYGGFPTRYPHWSFGMQYEELRKGYEYGLSKIYEMVINNDPCYAYLMRSNHTVDQKLVMAHVYGHADFFKNNAYFAHTSKKMMDEMANHGVRIRRYAEKHGEDEVESFIDRCMSIDDLIDNAPIKPWQRDVLSIIRDEAYYFAPQAQTKIANEGWACLAAASWVFTTSGLRRMGAIAQGRERVAVSDGEKAQAVYDWAAF